MTRSAEQTDMIELDGNFGEGGGQILRSALALSMITGRSFHIQHIRGNRSKPGLLRQHLTAVNAAATVGGGEVTGAALGSSEITFRPGAVRGGDYAFSIGTAGSTTLVLQTVLPALLTASEPSTVTLEGGTHNNFAPTVDFLSRAFLPIVEQMGPEVHVELLQHGFYPSGGGRIRVNIKPVRQLTPVDILERGDIVGKQLIATVVNVPGAVARRELKVLQRRLSASADELVLREIQDAPSTGNVVSVEIQSQHVTEVFTGFGERRISAERVAERAAEDVLAYLAKDVPVWHHLADQLMLPFALAGGGAYRTAPLTPHAETNAEVIERFLPVRVVRTTDADGANVTVGFESV